MSVKYTSNSGGPVVLHYIANNQNATIREVANALGAEEATVQRTVQKLYHSGFVDRQERTQNGRHRNPFEYSLAPLSNVDQ